MSVPPYSTTVLRVDKLHYGPSQYLSSHLQEPGVPTPGAVDVSIIFLSAINWLPVKIKEII
jgi:hypothetical protein